MFRKDRNHLYLDGLLFAAVAYAFAFVILKMARTYYFVPSMLLAAPSFAYWANHNIIRKNALSVIISIVVLLCCGVYNNFPAIKRFFKMMLEKRISDISAAENIYTISKALRIPIYFYKNNNSIHSNYTRMFWTDYLEYIAKDKNIIASDIRIPHLPNRGIIIVCPSICRNDMSITKELKAKNFLLMKRVAGANIYICDKKCSKSENGNK
ncbi:MAG: hypothetical protein LBD81_02630 [Holosporaceae bacterium]|jgi:hypothetical protein|nr:hypothetical protein [Holosporaceae bacterium]